MSSILILLTIIVNQFAFGPPREKKIDSFSQVTQIKGPEAGINLGFIDNRNKYFSNYGKISRKSKLDLDGNTIYENGSVTKLFHPTLLSQDQYKGKLKIEDFMDNYLPEEHILSKKIQDKLKISDLASHQ